MLKNRLFESPILAQSNFNKPFIVETIAPSLPIREFLSQKGDEERFHAVQSAIGYSSGAEHSCTVFEKAALALKFALLKLFHYLLSA